MTAWNINGINNKLLNRLESLYNINIYTTRTHKSYKLRNGIKYPTSAGFYETILRIGLGLLFFQKIFAKNRWKRFPSSTAAAFSRLSIQTPHVKIRVNLLLFGPNNNINSENSRKLSIPTWDKVNSYHGLKFIRVLWSKCKKSVGL